MQLTVVDLRFFILIFVFKQKTAYDMRISDWSSDVCSSDLADNNDPGIGYGLGRAGDGDAAIGDQPLLEADGAVLLDGGVPAPGEDRGGARRLPRLPPSERLAQHGLTEQPLAHRLGRETVPRRLGDEADTDHPRAHPTRHDREPT